MQTLSYEANGWLIDNVGNRVMASDGLLVQSDNKWVWRLHAYLTSLAHEPYGPIGDILSDQQTIELMYARGERFIHPT